MWRGRETTLVQVGQGRGATRVRGQWGPTSPADGGGRVQGGGQGRRAGSLAQLWQGWAPQSSLTPGSAHCGRGLAWCLGAG